VGKRRRNGGGGERKTVRGEVRVINNNHADAYDDYSLDSLDEPIEEFNGSDFVHDTHYRNENDKYNHPMERETYVNKIAYKKPKKKTKK
jgi:hypothetical protein